MSNTWISFQYPMGAIHSTKISKRKKSGAKTSWESLQNIRKSLNFQKATIQPKIQDIPRRTSSGTEVRSKKFLKFSAHLARLSPFPEILGNALAFVTGKFPIIQMGIFHPLKEFLLILYFLVFTKTTVKILNRLPQPDQEP